MHRAAQRWLASNDNLPDNEDCVVVLCTAGTPAVDIVVLLRREDGSRFYLSVQVKHTRFGSTPLDLQTVRNTEELFRRKLGSMRKRRSTFAQLPDDVYLVFITNRDTPGVAADALPARTAVLNTQAFMGATFARMAEIHVPPKTRELFVLLNEFVHYWWSTYNASNRPNRKGGGGGGGRQRSLLYPSCE